MSTTNYDLLIKVLDNLLPVESMEPEYASNLRCIARSIENKLKELEDNSNKFHGRISQGVAKDGVG